MIIGLWLDSSREDGWLPGSDWEYNNEIKNSTLIYWGVAPCNSRYYGGWLERLWIQSHLKEHQINHGFVGPSYDKLNRGLGLSSFP